MLHVRGPYAICLLEQTDKLPEGRDARNVERWYAVPSHRKCCDSQHLVRFYAGLVIDLCLHDGAPVRRDSHHESANRFVGHCPRSACFELEPAWQCRRHGVLLCLNDKSLIFTKIKRSVQGRDFVKSREPPYFVPLLRGKPS